MKRMLIFAFGVACVISGGVALAREGNGQSAAAASTRTPASGNSIYLLHSEWTDQDGHSIRLTKFQGRPLIVAMIYTSCKDTCPLIVNDMQRIEKALPETARDRVRFALVSFDPAQDSPSQLKSFATAHALDTKRWTLLTGSVESVRMLAAVLGVRYQKQSTGDFAHSSVITVLDSRGEIRHQQTGVRKEPDQVASVVNEILSSGK